MRDKNNRARVRRCILAAATILLVLSCSTAPAVYRSEELLRVSGKKHLPEPILSLRVLPTNTRDARETPAELTSPLLPALTLKGFLYEAGGGERRFVVTRLRVFDNWDNGWTEAEFEASGILLLRREYLSWHCKTSDPPSLWGIDFGEIRYYDTYFRNAGGAGKAAARLERVREAVWFLREGRGRPEIFANLDAKARPDRAFRDLVEGVFFPRGPAGGVPTGSSAGGSEIPPSLRPLLEGQTLYRDYEEAPRLWLSFFNLPFVEGRLSEGITFLYKD
jgi:hypothetical protein